MRRFLFLDVDGVLNSEKYLSSTKHSVQVPATMLDPYAIGLIIHILETIAACLVLSSSWRYATNLRHAINQAFQHVKTFVSIPIPCTPILGDRCRGDEIEVYLKNTLQEEWYYPNRDYRYVILDDDDDFLPHQKPFLVQTKWEVGLTDDDAATAIQILLN